MTHTAAVLTALCLWSGAAIAQERVVLTGCLNLGDAIVGRPATAPREDFVLTNATRETPMPVPADVNRSVSGGVAAGGSLAVQSSSFPAAVGTSGTKGAGAVYALDGNVKDLAKRAGRRVEIIGRLGPATRSEFERVEVTGVRSLGSCQ